MAYGRLAGVLCSNVGQNLIYQGPATMTSTVIVSISSLNGEEVTAQAFLTAGAAPVDADAISPPMKVKLTPESYTGLVIDENQRLYVSVDVADELVVSVNGLEGQI